MTTGAEIIEGLVLCRVGVDRLAIRAREITAFEIAHGQARYAGAGFCAGATAPADAKLLRHHHTGLVVDSVEVHSERLPLMPVPTVLRVDARTAWGGALAGFVEAGGLLWPVLSLERLSKDADAAGVAP